MGLTARGGGIELTLAAAAVVVAGLMVCAELAVAALVHPTLWRVPDGVHAAATFALARVFGRVMPFWYAGTLLLTISVAAVFPWQARGSSWARPPRSQRPSA